MGLIIMRAIDWFADFIILILCIGAIVSWFATASAKAREISIAIDRFTEPVVLPCRWILAKLNLDAGLIDWAYLLAFFLVRLVARVLITIVSIIF